MIIETKGITVDTDAIGWRKSSYSGGNSDNCVEVATLDGGTAVRDSKNPDGPVLVFTTAEWTAFGAGMAAGEF